MENKEGVNGVTDQGPEEVADDQQGVEQVSPELKACTFTVGGEVFSIPMEHVMEIAEVSEIFPLPLTPSYVDGIVHFRGVAIPVINIGKIMEIEEERKIIKQLIVVDSGGEKFGIAVNERPYLTTGFSGELINVRKFYESYRVA